MSETPLTMVWRPREHIPVLDGVRGIAILMVALFRFGREAATEADIETLLGAMLRIGERGVDLFFVLSGFLITGILLDAKGKPGFFTTFYIRRTLRIFPLYYVALLLCLFVVPALAVDRTKFDMAAGQQFYLWTYLMNAHMAWVGEWCFGALDHFWSLAVEEHFYLMWPMVVFALGTPTLFRFSMLLAVISFALRTGFLLGTNNRVAADVFTFFRMEGLCLGASLAAWMRCANADRIQRFRKPGICLLIGAILVTLLLAISGKSMFTVGHSLWAMVWALALYWVVTSKPHSIVTTLLSVSWLRHFGKISYAMYVFQNPLMVLIGGYLSTHLIAESLGIDKSLGGLFYGCLLFAATWIAALLSWHALEKHCLRLRQSDRWIRRFTSFVGQRIPRCRLKF